MSELKGYLVNYIMDENFLIRKLQEREGLEALRSLRHSGGEADFFSNDYLGIVRNGLIEKLLTGSRYAHGSTGSRLLAGNYPLVEEAEKQIALFHDAPAALFSIRDTTPISACFPVLREKGILILYDKLSHASIRDGIRQSFADSFSFAHNDLQMLEEKLQKRKGNCFVVTESVFSMDGDQAPLTEMAGLCEKYEAHLIVDEAHATGVIGERGEGVVQSGGLQNRCFARIHTFGKALGCHGAVILGSEMLRNFLVNFCRPFIYSTAIPPDSVAAILASYKIFPEMKKERDTLTRLIEAFDLPGFRKSDTPIQCFVVPGNSQVKQIAQNLLKQNLDVRPILYPTVPLGEERLRITLHSFNSIEETRKLISILLNR